MSNPNLSTAIRERGTAKAQLTRLQSFLTRENLDIDDLQTRKVKLEEYNKSFLQYQLIIEELQTNSIGNVTNATNLDEEFDAERIEFEEKYFACLKVIHKKIRELTESSSSTLNNTSFNNSNNVPPKQTHSLFPKIEISPFDGTPTKWHTFYDTFKYVVHDNDTLQPVEKFHFFKNSLRGEAANVINALSASAEGYSVAWELLIQQFDKPRIIIQAHLKSFLEIPDIVKDSPVNLRSLLEKAQLHLNALKALKLDIKSWDPFLVYIITSKLDKFTRRAWERSLENDDMPKYEDLLTFLKKQARGEELDTSEKLKQKQIASNQNKRGFSYVGTSYSCPICTESHAIYACAKFKTLSPKGRADAARNARLCLNCLRDNHKTLRCRCTGCKICAKKHNTMLHFESTKTEQGSTLNNRPIEQKQLTEPIAEVTYAVNSVTYDSEVLLGTACIKILDKNKREHDCRVLLDGGSQAHFISEDLANRLGLEKHTLDVPFCGLGNNITRSQYYVKTHIKSNMSDYTQEVNFVALPRITGLLPSRKVDRNAIAIPYNITLADPEFHKSKPIDALLGNTIFYSLLQIGQIKLCNNSIILQKTQIGWIITGEAEISGLSKQLYPKSSFFVSCNLEANLQKFWEVEELQTKKFLSNEEALCEAHFSENTKRDQSGRYIVRIPFKNQKFELRGSFNLALKRLYSLENKLSKNKALYEPYANFLSEYLELGHMTNITNTNNCNSGHYLPHHPVIKESSLTTKLRVVFDASAKDSNNVSLNDIMMTGPTIQDNLISIIIRFRTHRFVLTADIEKMFRQILVDQRDSEYQKILWRNSKDEPIQVYKLNTVTYGTTSAPFLAVRCLMQLAHDDGIKYPLAAKVLVRDFYMDDLLTGTNDYNEAILLKKQLIKLLSLGGFNLRQWAANDNTLLEDVASTSQCLDLDYNGSKKVLGVQWDPKNDTINYLTQTFNSEKRLTKRIILSEIAQLFDPLGLVSPIVVKAKILMQELWKAKLNWDESIPQSLHTEWSSLKVQLCLLNEFKIPRKVLQDDFVDIQLHGFCDASQQAYGACIYLRTTDKSNRYASYLVCSKSRVAPIKTISLPRLELCAAVLLVRLYETTSVALNLNYSSIRFWSDSTIALNWINKPPYVWETFVANRVSIIQNSTDISNWNHISSSDNPADFVSRGQMPCELINNKQWFHGPIWLSQNESEWPLEPIPTVEDSEKRTKVALVVSLDSDSIFKDFSSLSKLNRFVAYCLRWMSRYRGQIKMTGELTAREIQNAHMRVLKLVQASHFQKEIQLLEQNKNVHNKSRILSLTPFIDNDGILRVGGRLNKSKLNYAGKHPVLLPKNNHVTELIIREEHYKNYHTGIQTTLSLVRQKYWPLDGKNIARKIIHKCVICRKVKPTQTKYLMGSLPENRVTQSRPFENVGIDYCGPFHLKEKKHRNCNSIKAYVVVFVCFAIKAVHLELTTDLTTESCLAAIRRFFSRRGKSKNIYTDNATNFVGAKNEIQEIQNQIESETFNTSIFHKLASEGVNWHFIPPRSPHFGGLWEAGVKSFKQLLYRSINKFLYTYEEFNTFITEIEAILNSRPLTPLDPNDLSALTAGHFLIGDSLQTLPEVDQQETPDNRLKRWQQLQKVKQQFWSRWHREYLNNLNVRNKWHQGNADEIKVGTLVTLKEDNTPPMCWKLGRIIEVHPGDDNIVRVATVKTATGTYKRSTKNLCPLPIPTL